MQRNVMFQIFIFSLVWGKHIFNPTLRRKKQTYLYEFETRSGLHSKFQTIQCDIVRLYLNFFTFNISSIINSQNLSYIISEGLKTWLNVKNTNFFQRTTDQIKHPLEMLTIVCNFGCKGSDIFFSGICIHTQMHTRTHAHLFMKLE